MTDKTPTDAQQYLNVASQCAATATSELAKNVLVDDGSGTLRELLNDAADAIRAGWGQPAPAQAQADSVPAAVTVEDAIKIAKSIGVDEYGPNTRNWSFEYSQLAQFVALLAAARAPEDSVLEDAHALLQDVAACFTRDDDLPNNLLPRIDAVLAARKQGGV